MAASLEARSEHPLALAIMGAARERNLASLPVDDVQVAPGMGISGRVKLDGVDYGLAVGNRTFMTERGLVVSEEAQQKLALLAEAGQTPLLLALEKNGSTSLAGILALADALRPESASVVAALRGMGVRVVMLTGDNERTAKAVAALAGVEEIAAGLLPADKAAYVRRMQDEGHVVGMVGDGINDAPALAAANVGMAVGTGVDVSAGTAWRPCSRLWRSRARPCATSARISFGHSATTCSACLWRQACCMLLAAPCFRPCWRARPWRFLPFP